MKNFQLALRGLLATALSIGLVTQASAQDAIQAKDWDAANAAIAEANALEGKTPYETYMTNEMAWYVLLQQKKYPEAAVILEQQVASGLIPPADLPARTKALTQLSYQNKQYDKAIDYGKKYMALNPSDQDIAMLVATSYYMKNDFAMARTESQKLIASATGKPPEALLQLQLRTNVELNDRPGTLQALEDMIRFYPQKKYWEDLLNAQLFLQNGERDLHRFLRNLEDAVIATCTHFGLSSASREPGKTGVWCDDATGARRKLCSMGIACRKWVTFHGLALNVTTDLSYFGRINPCGFESRVMTSMTVWLVAERLSTLTLVATAGVGRTLHFASPRVPVASSSGSTFPAITIPRSRSRLGTSRTVASDSRPLRTQNMSNERLRPSVPTHE